jgi:hypothetical protein
VEGDSNTNPPSRSSIELVDVLRGNETEETEQAKDGKESGQELEHEGKPDAD